VEAEMRSMKRGVHREGCVSQKRLFSRVLVIEIESSLFTTTYSAYFMHMSTSNSTSDVRKRVYSRFTSSLLYSSRSLARLLLRFAIRCLICFHQHVIPLYAERFVRSCQPCYISPSWKRKRDEAQ